MVARAKKNPNFWKVRPELFCNIAPYAQVNLDHDEAPRPQSKPRARRLAHSVGTVGDLVRLSEQLLTPSFADHIRAKREV